MMIVWWSKTYDDENIFMRMLLRSWTFFCSKPTDWSSQKAAAELDSSLPAIRQNKNITRGPADLTKNIVMTILIIWWSSYDKFVAPRYPVKMKEVAAHVNLPNLLSDEFEAYAKVYQAIVVEKQYSSVDTARSFVALSIQNDADVLAVLGKDKILDTIRKNAPVLREQKLDKLTEAELQSFFFQARTYLLNSQAPYWSFPEYFLNAGGQICSVHFGRNTEIQSRNTRNTPKYPSHSSGSF